MNLTHAKERIVNRIILKNIIINKLGLIPPKQLNENVNKFTQVMDKIKKDINTIADESENLDDFKLRVDTYIKANPMTTSGNMPSLLKAVESVKGVFDARMDKFGVGSLQKLSSEVIRENSTVYMTKLGEDVQSQLKSILESGINQKMPVSEIQQEMLSKVDGLSKNRAESIARTETMNAYNQAEKERANELGWTDFVVISSADCCEQCYDLYNGNTFKSPDDDDIIPPLHPNCNCEQRFVPNEKKAEDMAELVSRDRPDLEK